MCSQQHWIRPRPKPLRGTNSFPGGQTGNNLNMQEGWKCSLRPQFRHKTTFWTLLPPSESTDIDSPRCQERTPGGLRPRCTIFPDIRRQTAAWWKTTKKTQRQFFKRGQTIKTPKEATASMATTTRHLGGNLQEEDDAPLQLKHQSGQRPAAKAPTALKI